MKLMPMQLGPINTAVANASTTHHNQNSGLSTPVDRLPFFSSDLIWRYPPFNFPLSGTTANHTTSTGPMSELRQHLPSSIASDPRIWNREDVISFLRWCESEFDLPNFDMELFQMNGKALCLLTKQDLGQRCPGAGDLLYNILQLMIRESYCLPSSPVTPHFPLTPNWCVPHTPTSLPQLCNSVALSPAPSIDSQSGSPRHLDSISISTSTPTTLHTSSAGTSIFHYPSISSTHGYAGSNGASSGSNQSDSDQEDSNNTPNSMLSNSRPKGEPVPEITITPRTPTLLLDNSGSPPQSPCVAFNKTMSFFSNPSDSPSSVSAEPNTNGRLLWDFLQQLLNDSMQRYTNYIAWKNRESGVFKIVDPPGLAKLWGIQKNHLSMNYDKMSRALRYYYRVNILRKVQGERHCYQFLRNPSELKSIKNISLLRQQMSAAAPTSSSGSNPSTPTTPTFSSPFSSSPIRQTIKSEPIDQEFLDEPTDLSIGNGKDYVRDRENHRSNHREREVPSNHRDGSYESKMRMEYDTNNIKLEGKKEEYSSSLENNNSTTSMHLQLNIKNQNLSSPQDLTLKHEVVHYETANSYA